MNGLGTFWETPADRAVARISDVLKDINVPSPLQGDQRAFLRLIEGRVGKGRALPIPDIVERLRKALAWPGATPDKTVHLMSERRVKEIVHELRLTYGIPVGASRDASGGGYYIVSTTAEAEESTQQMFNQAISMLRVVAVMRSKTAAELFDQIRTALEKKEEDALAR